MAERNALIVGATGLIGSFCLQNLFNDSAYSEAIALVRRPLLEKHRKLKEIITDFSDLDRKLSTVNAHDVFCCLGTTIKKAGSQQAFRQVDYELVVTVAELMKEKGAEQFIVISAMGANKDSRIFYNRVKGEMEEAVKEVGYSCLRIIRPSLLLGKREEFRFAERVGVLLNPLLKLILVGLLKNYRPVEADKVGWFMVKIAHERPVAGVHIYESNQICD